MNLLDPGASYRAQNGEDRWLDAYFGGRSEGFYVEVGAYDGYNLSNTYHFEQLGWEGILVEPDPQKAALCRANRPRARTYACAMVGPQDGGQVTFYQVEEAGVYSTTALSASHEQRLSGKGHGYREITVPARTLDSVLEEVAPEKVDFITIDVEGGELAVLSGFDIRRWQPELVIVESNARVRDPRVRDYFLAHGYAYRHSIDVNDFYQRRRLGRAPWGQLWLRAVDGGRYRMERCRRRLARLAFLARRAWNKRLRARGG